MAEWHSYQLTGSKCGPRNCAACAAADAIAAATAGHVKLTGDQVRTESGVSCVPGEHSASGGLFISDVVRVAAAHGVTLDYGPAPAYTRWPADELAKRLEANDGAVVLGDYDALPPVDRAPGSTFLGDHSAFVHDYRSSDRSVCWHDPLRRSPIRIAAAAVVAYWQKPGSPIRGLAGFVKLPVVAGWWDPVSRLGPPPTAATFAITIGAGSWWHLDAAGNHVGQFRTGGFTAYGGDLARRLGRETGRLLTGSRAGFWIPLGEGTVIRKPGA